MARNSVSPGIYNGGAVVFNPGASVQYYNQMLQHKQAKDEALGRYYQDLGKNINGAGMRTQDIEGGWNDKVNKWDKFYIENSDAIKNPMKYGPSAQNEFYSRYRDILNDVEKSKKAGAMEGMVGQKMLDPKWRDQTTDQDLAISHNMSRSIYDPEHYRDGHTTPYGPEDFSFNAPRFDLNQQKAAVNALTQGLPRGESQHPTERPVIDQNAKTVTVPMVAGYDKPTYDKIIERGVNVYNSGQAAQRYFENELHNPDDLAVLNGPFKKYFGKDISSPQDVARAWAMQNVPQTVPGKDKIRGWSDPDAALNRQEAYYDYKDKKKAEAAAADDASVENFMKGLEEQGKKGGPFPYRFSDTGETVNTYNIALTPALKKIFTVRVGAHLSEPDALHYNPETGDYLPIHYQKKDGVPIKGANGQYAVSESIPTQPVAREAVKASLATILPKRAIKQLGGGAPPAAPVAPAPAPAPAPAKKAKTVDDEAESLLLKYLKK